MKVWTGSLAALLLLAGGTSFAQAADRRAEIAEVGKLIQKNYVVPEKRAAIAAKLEQSLAAGRYASDDPKQFAQAVTEDLKAVSSDGHLYLQHDPAQAAAIGTQQRDDRLEGEFWAKMARRMNHGVTELKILDGNVRYMNLAGFVWLSEAESGAALADAMRFLKGGDAAIIDLRQNGGGSPEAVRYIASHFVEPGRHLITFHMPDGVTRGDALRELPAGRLTGKPLYVLTGRRSASAAEEFAYHVSAFKLGELVGETTAGAANRNELFRVASDYVLSVSVGRPEHPVTKTNWEGAGVKPTMATSEPEALDIAHAAALERIAASAPEQEKGRYVRTAAAIRARARPAPLAAPAEAYAGRFGERTVSVEGGQLFWQRDGGPKSRLLAIAPDTFVVEADPSTQVKVKRENGRAASVEITRGDGSTVTAARTGNSSGAG